VLIAVAIIASLGFIGWLIYRAIKQRPIRAYIVTRGIAYLIGVYAFAYFISMDIPQLIKVIVSIILGAALIVLAAFLQRHRQTGKQ